MWNADGRTSGHEGGFDAVIGNPPWDRIKLQEVEWLETRGSRTGARRRRQRLVGRVSGGCETAGAPLADEFDKAKERADRLGQLVRRSGDYPSTCSSGDINLYSLFVERAMDLVKPDGFVGLHHAVRHLRR